VALCAVSNFTSVRRLLGQVGWTQAMSAFVERLRDAMPDVAVQQIAPDCLELCFHAYSETGLRDLLRKCEACAGSDEAARNFRLVFGAGMGGLDCDPLTLQEHAERALEEASRGQKLVVIATDEKGPAFEEIAILRDLPDAAARNEFFLLYQPKVNVRQQTIPSAEALIRWLHPHHGLIMPDAFIDAADASGDIFPIALWTLDRVIADQAMLAERGQHLRLFINVSGRLLTDETFISSACALVQSTGADIGFEITETSVIHDPALAIRNLEKCAAVGIELAIDDYGSGLSSLAYLKQLPARELKIDKQFITDLTSSHRDPLIVRSTIDLAHALDMEVTAEGVETPAALALLTVMGCEMVQGYLISPPLKLDAFAKFLQDYRLERLQPDTVPTVIRPASFWKRAG
jgi:diguanylate cyclase